MRTDTQFYAQDEQVKISKELLVELIDIAGCFRTMYNDWKSGVTPENHPDLNAVEYLLDETERIRHHARQAIPELAGQPLNQ